MDLAFTCELALNARSRGSYNFDVIVVTLSLVGLAPTGLPVRLVLLLRCSRALRIFGKLKSVAIGLRKFKCNKSDNCVNCISQLCLSERT